ncbi:hypothetical protein BLA60_06185 [Actinophytocola xinjiangensis]|uniref:ESAT-6 protein secretion system EspG family protein n=1 Tax=Actinophytocola xinjiangensis TaxID=485602 RepID=A0A7Z0WR99_9PSEU|nr:hypothetical protein BLA60_06185 [Actinophytocola xinjiangensis]
MVIASPLTLSADALGRLVRAERLGDLHVTLRPLARWRPRPDQEQLEADERDEFLGLGLIDDSGRLDPDVAATFGLLCRPGAEFYGWISEGERTRGVLAAASGRDAVLAIRDRDTVTINQIRADALPDVLVAQAPDVLPARGDTFAFLRSEVFAASGGRHRTDDDGPVRSVHQIMAQPTTGGGELNVAVRDRTGRRRTAPYPLRYVDTDAGRWLNHMTDAGGGEHNVLVAPATRTDLVRRLQDMHRALLG